MSAPALNDLDEPDRTYWLQRGLVGLNAEAEAQEANRPKSPTA